MYQRILVCVIVALSIQGALLLPPQIAYGTDVAIENTESLSSPSSSIAAEEISTQKVSEIDMIQMIKYGGIVGYTIIFLSIIAIALVIEYSFTIRKAALMPPKAIDQIRKLIEKKRHHEIAASYGNTLIGKIVSAGMAETAFGYNAMLKAMEDSGEESGGKLVGRIEHLNIIGNIAPMLGLLGTVIGMLITFNRIFEASEMTGIVDPRQLAGGIFKALVTTVMGLIVAIPSLYASALFRNRINAIFAEVMTVAGQLISPFKSAPIQGEKVSEDR